jgi:hypothetical protein
MSSVSTQSQQGQLLDWATEAAISASRPDRDGNPIVDKATVNNLLAFLQSRRSVKELMAYIIRQGSRGEIDEQTAKLLLKYVKGLELKDALTFLGYFKWIYEGLTGDLRVDSGKLRNVKTFKGLVDVLAS